MKKWYLLVAGGLLCVSIIIFASLQLLHWSDKKDKIEYSPSNNEDDYSEYNSTLNRIYALNIGDYFVKENLKTFECNKPDYYTIWTDVHIQEASMCLYEIKGADNKTGDIAWRYYIKTENNFITSIKKK